MNLILIGQISEYRIFSLLKMFFPSEKFHLTDKIDGDSIALRIKQGRNSLYLLACVRLSGKLYRRHEVISQNTDEEFLWERLCAVLYQVLREALEVTLPWGMLSGVRPVKRVRQMLERENISPDIVPEKLEQRFFVSREKSELCLRTYEIQKTMELRNAPKEYSLYISIPFCPTKCGYCSFISQAVSAAGSLKLIENYIQLLIKELELISEIAAGLGLVLKNIYVGGGTPTVLNTPQLKQVLDSVRNFYDISGCKEYTVEAGRPDTITLEKLKLLKASGVTRLSVNPQSFNDKVLEGIGREHTAQLTVDCFRMAREIGFDWINMDVIAGLPEDTLDSFKHTIEKAVMLSPENITMHVLTVKRASKLHEEKADNLGEYASEMVSYGSRFLLKNGYNPYYLYRQKNMVDNLENVGYSKNGFESPYNVCVMEENQNILAAGAGAVSKLVFDGKIERIFNYKHPIEYNKNFKEIVNRKNKVVSLIEDYNKR